MSNLEFSPEMLNLLKTQLIPELTESIRKQVMEEFKQEEQRKEEENKLRRQRENEAITAYSDTMKKSPEPWVDIRGYTHEADGRLKIELDWNDAFIEQCKKQGLSGTSDEQIIQKYLALLTQNIDQQLTDEAGTTTPFE